MHKVWLITGCSKGFGLKLVEELLASTDAKIVATARNPEHLQQTLKISSDRLLILPLDVTKQSDIDNAVQETLKKFGRIDVLVNNAGYGQIGALEEVSMEAIKTQFDTNVFGLMALTKAVLPVMRKQREGYIFNFSSILGLVGAPGAGIYCSSKHAVEGLSEALAQEVSPFGIKVTIIEPGPFRTDFLGGSLRLPEPIADYNGTPAGNARSGMPTGHGKQIGDPVKAVKIIIMISEMPEPPLRILLGNPGLARLRQKLDQFMSELLKNEAITKSADYPS